VPRAACREALPLHPRLLVFARHLTVTTVLAQLTP
jgi:hypothetical protein